MIEPPTGNIARYEVQYRDAGQTIANTALVDGRFNFFVARNIDGASSYEVRTLSPPFSNVHNSTVPLF